MDSCTRSLSSGVSLQNSQMLQLGYYLGITWQLFALCSWPYSSPGPPPEQWRYPADGHTLQPYTLKQSASRAPMYWTCLDAQQVSLTATQQSSSCLALKGSHRTCRCIAISFVQHCSAARDMSAIKQSPSSGLSAATPSQVTSAAVQLSATVSIASTSASNSSYSSSSSSWAVWTVSGACTIRLHCEQGQEDHRSLWYHQVTTFLQWYGS